MSRCKSLRKVELAYPELWPEQQALKPVSALRKQYCLDSMLGLLALKRLHVDGETKDRLTRRVMDALAACFQAQYAESHVEIVVN